MDYKMIQEIVGRNVRHGLCSRGVTKEQVVDVSIRGGRRKEFFVMSGKATNNFFSVPAGL